MDTFNTKFGSSSNVFIDPLNQIYTLSHFVFSDLEANNNNNKKKQ